MSSFQLELNDGSKHPMVGFGTYKVGFVPPSASNPSAVDLRDPVAIIKDAVDVGYRYFDCAQFYGNEKIIGDALSKCGVPREELYLVSKVWTSTIFEGADAVKKQVEQCLDDLQTDYIDLFLVHWPVPGKHIEAYLALEEMLKEGKVKGIGVSNYTIEDYEELKEATSVKPLVNQIEVNPFLYRKNTIQYFQAEGIQLEAYRAIKQGKALGHEKIVKLAEKYKKTGSQIMTRWCLHHNIIVLAKSAKKARMEENFLVDDFEMTPEDVASLDDLTTPEALDANVALYKSCLFRDTPKQDTTEGIRETFTID